MLAIGEIDAGMNELDAKRLNKKKCDGIQRGILLFKRKRVRAGTLVGSRRGGDSGGTL